MIGVKFQPEHTGFSYRRLELRENWVRLPGCPPLGEVNVNLFEESKVTFYLGLINQGEETLVTRKTGADGCPDERGCGPGDGDGDGMKPSRRY